MKNNIIYISLIVLLMVTSCDEPIELYPLDVPAAETFYTNQVEIQGGVNACYSFVIAPGNGYLNPEYSWDGLTDLVFLRISAFAQANMNGSLDYTEGYFRTYYLNMYQGVARCNLILEKIEENKDLLSAEDIKQFQGEIYFLRGYYYLQLINAFGDVVYLDKTIASVDEASTVTRTAKSEVLQKIYADFDLAAQLLDGSSENAVGRATSGAAMAFKARAALQNNDWSTAATAAKLLIDTKQYSLMPSYETLFNKEVIYSAGNTEQIFSRGHLVAAGTEHRFMQYTGQRTLGWVTIVPTQNMLDSYQCTDGKNIAESSVYDKAQPYENRDPRMRYSLVVPGDLWGPYVFDTHVDSVMTLNADGEEVINPNSYSKTEFTSFTGYLMRKYYDWDYAYNPKQGENPFMICRYAEVLLTYAEAKIELGEIDDDCVAAINAVRERTDVMMPAVTAGSQDEMRKIVRSERKVELFNENLRWQDLVRWKRAEVVLNRPILGRPVLGGSEVYPDVSFDEYGDPVYNVESYVSHPSTDYRVLIRPDFHTKNYLWPIPETEISLNPELGQNEGW